MKIIHLYHSGILIETPETQVFIDAITGVNEHIDLQKKVFFLVSHGHQDHYDPVILKYAHRQVHYLISDDLHLPHYDRLQLVKPGGDYHIGRLRVKTYASTDRGVSFVIHLDQWLIFHAGDLNWWHWENDDPTTQSNEESQFKTIMDGIEERSFDVACVPVDPRLGPAFYWTAAYALETMTIGTLVPIHFRKQFDTCEQLIQKLHHNKAIVNITSCNQMLTL